MGRSIAGVESSPKRAATSAAGPGNPRAPLPLATISMPSVFAAMPALRRQSSAAATPISATVASGAAHRRSRIPETFSIHSRCSPSARPVPRLRPLARVSMPRTRADRRSLRYDRDLRDTRPSGRWNRISGGSDPSPEPSRRTPSRWRSPDRAAQRIEQSAFKEGFLFILRRGLSGDLLYQFSQALAAARIGAYDYRAIACSRFG